MIKIFLFKKSYFEDSFFVKIISGFIIFSFIFSAPLSVFAQEVSNETPSIDTPSLDVSPPSIIESSDTSLDHKSSVCTEWFIFSLKSIEYYFG